MTTTDETEAALAKKHDDARIRLAVAKGCVQRMEAMGWKGKKRGDACMDYLTGAMSGYLAATGQDADDPKAECPFAGLIYTSAFRGYENIESYVRTASETPTGA